jgi:hypothetical protein
MCTRTNYGRLAASYHNLIRISITIVNWSCLSVDSHVKNFASGPYHYWYVCKAEISAKRKDNV